MKSQQTDSFFGAFGGRILREKMNFKGWGTTYKGTSPVFQLFNRILYLQCVCRSDVKISKEIDKYNENIYI